MAKVDASSQEREESLFRGLLDAAPDAMVIVDASGHIVLVNSQAEQLFGYARSELVGQPVELLIPERFRGTHPPHRRRYFDEPKPRPMGVGGLELWGLHKNGLEIPVEISLSPLYTDRGVLAMTAIRDITERKRAEQERAQLHTRARELEALKTKFFANVSHELRTPLTLILGPIERLLGRPDLEAAMRRELEGVHRNATVLLKHVNDLLDVAKLEADAMTPEYARVELGRLLRHVAGNFDGLALDRSVRLHIDVGKPLTVELDPEKIGQVLINLLANAFKFTPKGGDVRLSARARGDTVLIEVADSGPGIPEAERQRVFERFRQLEGGGRARMGTGLGLAIARDLVELHRGRIAVSQAPEGGALFTMELPRSAPMGVQVAEAWDRVVAPPIAMILPSSVPPPAPPPAPGQEDSDQPLVLVVEDNPEMNEFICRSLGRRYRVQPAYDGHEGLRYAELGAPDLILTDLMMPGMSGDELLQRLRGDARFDDVPVVVLTAKADDALRLSLLQHGAQDYVMKPFSERELEARISNLIAVKRMREVLRAELQSQAGDLEVLARELVHNRKALRAAVEAANEARDQAARESRAKSDFLSMISHEMRTPLTAMLLLLENLRSHQDNFTEHQRDRLRRVMASAQRFSHLVDSLLQQQRLTSGRVERKVVSFSFERLVKEVRDEVLPLIEQKRLTLELEVPEDLSPLHSDPTLVRLILVNLLGNAIKFTQQGKITLSATQTAEGLRVVVSDSGVGIAEADQERVFAAFEQLEEVVSKSKPGVGLGLALVRSITALLGGRVELSSRLGHGSAFAVTLPDLKPELAVGSADREA